ncbi:MAG: hypothetical protein ABMB14_20165 [Myxococcota bacterium]
MSNAIRWTWVWSLAVAGCTGEFQFQSGPKVPPAEPPGDDVDEQGDPPDWQNCPQGWRGIYTNLKNSDEFVAPRANEDPAPTDPSKLPFWDQSSFEQFDPTLDFGQSWWPVNEGLEDDPKYFAVYWHAWIRAWSNTTLSFLLGAQDDVWVYVNGDPIAEQPGIHDTFERTKYDIYLDAGQYPIEVWYAHRGSEISAMSFRVVSGDVSVCYPTFGEDTPTAP